MPRSDRDERVTRLSEAARRRSAETRAKTERAITLLRSRGERITPTTVAQQAGVSVSYLSSQPDIRDRIRQLAGSSAAIKPEPRSSSEASLRTKLEVVTDRLREMEDEVAALRRENAALRGELLDLRRLRRAPD